MNHVPSHCMNITHLLRVNVLLLNWFLSSLSVWSFTVFTSIIYLTGQSLCISLTTPLSLIIKLFIWSWMLSWWITWRTIILISSIHPWRMKWTWNVCMKERPSIVPRDMLVIISFIFKLMIGLCLLRFVNVDQPYSSFHSLANKLSNWHQGIIATLDMQVAFLSSRFGWEHLMLEDVLSWCRNSSHPMRLQIDECLNIQCQCVVSIPWLELSGAMLLELMMTSDLLTSTKDQEQQCCQKAILTYQRWLLWLDNLIEWKFWDFASSRGYRRKCWIKKQFMSSSELVSF